MKKIYKEQNIKYIEFLFLLTCIFMLIPNIFIKIISISVYLFMISKNKNLIFYSLLIFINFERTGNINLHIFHLKPFQIATIAYLFFNYNKLLNKKLINKNILILTVFIMLGFINLIYVEHFFTTLKMQLNYSMLFIIFIITYIETNEKFDKKCFYYFLVGLTIAEVIGVYSIILNYFPKGRLAGPFDSGHNFANLLLFAVPFSYFIFLNEKEKIIKYYILILFSLGIYLLYKANVRGAYLGFIFAFLFYTIFEYKNILKERKIIFYSGFLLFLVFFIIFKWSFFKVAFDIHFGVVTERLSPYKIILFNNQKIITLLFGKGVGVYNFSAHSSYFQIILERGILGLFFYCIFIFMILFKNIKDYIYNKEINKQYLILILFSLLAIQVQQGTVTQLTLAHIWVLYGMLLSSENIKI